MLAIIIFIAFVGFLFWLSWFLGRKSNTADGFFVANRQIHWFINGIALTGGYLSAASFLGICGMIAFKGFDGYLYSIGFLSGWVVALFVVAEPLRRLGRYTFADALGARFNSRNIHFAASISTLVICLCYLVPQMVGAGVLIEPLLGIAHHWGVIIVGAVVIVVVASAGMSSTTYVQFVKAGMLIIFSAVLVFAVCLRGLDSNAETRNIRGEIASPYKFQTLPAPANDSEQAWRLALSGSGLSFKDKISINDQKTGKVLKTFVLLQRETPALFGEDGTISVINRGQNIPIDPDSEDVVLHDQDGVKSVLVDTWWLWETDEGGDSRLREVQDVTSLENGDVLINGFPSSAENVLLAMGGVSAFGARSGHDGKKGWIGPLRILSIFADPQTKIEIPASSVIHYNGKKISLYNHVAVMGNIFMRPGGRFKLAEGGFWERLDFISLMIALFFGTAALPHVLIRYYTVKDATAARKSTIVAISSIGLFYILTMYLGLGAIANGVLNPITDNMSAPLLARAFGEVLFAIITALAFATVLGTVAGLIVAASGAVANDLMDRFLHISMTGKTKVFAARITALAVGLLSVILGILFRGVNVGFLVGWAFAVAASANFPAIIMALFWKRTTPAGIVASILVGILASVGVILFGPDMFDIYGLGRSNAWTPLSQPAIISMPLSFITVIAVSLLTKQGELNDTSNRV